MFIGYLLLLGLSFLVGLGVGRSSQINGRIKELNDYEMSKFIKCEECGEYCELGIEKDYVYSCSNEDCHCRYAIIDVIIEKY